MSKTPPPKKSFFAPLQPTYDGPASWLWFVGAARFVILVVVCGGTFLDFPELTINIVMLLLIYGAATISSSWYFIVLRREGSIPATLTWTQVLVDFGVVSATISYTGGQASFFTFLLVIVILEAGVLMGFAQGFIFALLATCFMLYQSMAWPPPEKDFFLHWYNFLIQSIAFFFTAFISGYWNQRINRMKRFQREILDNMNSGFLIADAKGIIIAINKAACQILGLDEENVTGRHVEGIMRPSSGMECPISTALRHEEDFSSYEFHAQTHHDQNTLLGLTTNRIHDTYGQLTGIIATFTDLTEMARMRQELQQQDRMAVVGELSAGLAHEIRNPVASIRGAADEMRKTDDAAMIKRLGKIAIRESDRLNEIVTSFLEFARDPSRPRNIVDIRGIAGEVFDSLKEKFAVNSSLALKIDLPDNPCPVLCDPIQIRQVFMNLGQNALEAMEAGGTLTITMKHTSGPIECTFEDEGPGIPPDKIARIFEPFFTEKAQGVGMGLAICMRLVNAHDGTIQAASRLQGGTVMTVRLPIAHEKESKS